MKKIAVCLLAILGLTAFGWAQRLPETAVPTNYKVSFAPNFTNDSFAGDEIIQLIAINTDAPVKFSQLLGFPAFREKSDFPLKEQSRGSGDPQRVHLLHGVIFHSSLAIGQ